MPATTSSCTFQFSEADCGALAPRCTWFPYQYQCLDCSLVDCAYLGMINLISASPGSVNTTPAPVVCSKVTDPSMCNNYCQWQYTNPNSSATDPPGGWVGYCRNRTCIDYGSAECLANNATCASYGDETVNFDFACYTRGMPPACSTLRSNSSCNYFSSSCYWIAEAFQCLQKGTRQP